MAAKKARTVFIQANPRLEAEEIEVAVADLDEAITGITLEQGQYFTHGGLTFRVGDMEPSSPGEVTPRTLVEVVYGEEGNFVTIDPKQVQPLEQLSADAVPGSEAIKRPPKKIQKKPAEKKAPAKKRKKKSVEPRLKEVEEGGVPVPLEGQVIGPENAAELAQLGTFRHRSESTGLHFLYDQPVMVVFTDSHLVFWDLGTGEPVKRVKIDGILADVTPEGTLCALLKYEHDHLLMEIIETERGQFVSTFILDSDKAYYASYSFHPDHEVLAGVYGSPAEQIFGVIGWDIKSGKIVNDMLLPHLKKDKFFDEKRLSWAAISPNHRYIATASSTIRLWNAANGEHLSKLKPSVKGSWKHLRFSSDESLLCAVSKLKGKQNSSWVVSVLDVASGRELCFIDMESEKVPHLALSPDNRLLVMSIWRAKDGREIQIWNVQPPLQLVSLGTVVATSPSPAFHPSGRLLVVCDFRNVVIWGVG